MEQVERENNTRQQETMRYDIEANADWNISSHDGHDNDNDSTTFTTP